MFDCSYFIFPLRPQHLAGKGLAHLPLFQMAISQIPALAAHISYLLWELKIWQTRSWKIYPPSQISISEIPALLWELIFGRWGLGRSTPISNGNFTDSCSGCSQFFPTLRAQHLADQVLADLPPLQMPVSQIPALLWEFIFGRPGVGRSPPPFKWQNHRFLFYSESSYLADQMLGNLPPSNGNFTDSCSDCSYFFPTLKTQHLADQVLAHLSPPSNGNFTDFCSDCSYFFPTLQAHI